MPYRCASHLFRDDLCRRFGRQGVGAFQTQQHPDQTGVHGGDAQRVLDTRTDITDAQFHRGVRF